MITPAVAAAVADDTLETVIPDNCWPCFLESTGLDAELVLEEAVVDTVMKIKNILQIFG